MHFIHTEIHTEVIFVEMYRGQALFGDIDARDLCFGRIRSHGGSGTAHPLYAGLRKSNLTVWQGLKPSYFKELARFPPGGARCEFLTAILPLGPDSRTNRAARKAIFT